MLVHAGDHDENFGMHIIYSYILYKKFGYVATYMTIICIYKALLAVLNA